MQVTNQGKISAPIYSEDAHRVINRMLLKGTSRLRWSKDFFCDEATGECSRQLQQCFIDGNGEEHWIAIPIEK